MPRGRFGRPAGVAIVRSINDSAGLERLADNLQHRVLRGARDPRKNPVENDIVKLRLLVCKAHEQFIEAIL